MQVPASFKTTQKGRRHTLIGHEGNAQGCTQLSIKGQHPQPELQVNQIILQLSLEVCSAANKEEKSGNGRNEKLQRVGGWYSTMLRHTALITTR